MDNFSKLHTCVLLIITSELQIDKFLTWQNFQKTQKICGFFKKRILILYYWRLYGYKMLLTKELSFQINGLGKNNSETLFKGKKEKEKEKEKRREVL